MVEVCLTPALIHQHDLKGKLVLVVDIFRATSCMVSGIEHGVAAIKPVLEINECLAHGPLGYILAGERGGQKIEGFDLGNSPFEYQQEDLVGRKVCISTTNGTRTLLDSLDGDLIVIGAFLNFSATVHYITEMNMPVVVHCAGWKGMINLEDTYYAGALIEALSGNISGDAAELAHQLYISHAHNPLKLANKSAHAQRLTSFGLEKDITYCMQRDEAQSVLIYEDGHVISASHS